MVQTITPVVSPVILRNSFLFKELGADVLSDVAAHCHHMTLQAGEMLFKQDSQPDAMYFLSDGQIHITRHYASGEEVILATEVPYYVIGELSLLANLPRTGSVTAVGNCDLIRINRETVNTIAHQYPEIAIKALKHLSKRLYKLNLRVRESAIGNTRARLANALLLMLNDQSETRIHTGRLARATAMDRDMVEHLIKRWIHIGMMSISGNILTVHDRQALKNIAG